MGQSLLKAHTTVLKAWVVTTGEYAMRYTPLVRIILTYRSVHCPPGNPKEKTIGPIDKGITTQNEGDRPSSLWLNYRRKYEENYNRRWYKTSDNTPADGQYLYRFYAPTLSSINLFKLFKRFQLQNNFKTLEDKPKPEFAHRSLAVQF